MKLMINQVPAAYPLPACSVLALDSQVFLFFISWKKKQYKGETQDPGAAFLSARDSGSRSRTESSVEVC